MGIRSFFRFLSQCNRAIGEGLDTLNKELEISVEKMKNENKQWPYKKIEELIKEDHYTLDFALEIVNSVRKEHDEPPITESDYNYWKENIKNRI